LDEPEQIEAELLLTAIGLGNNGFGAPFRGRIVKTTGDGLFVEFASVVDAVRWAVEREMVVRNAVVPQERRTKSACDQSRRHHQGRLRHLATSMGDSVNIAAERGGFRVSRVIRDPVRDKLDFAFEDADERLVKNIACGAHPTVPETLLVPRGWRGHPSAVYRRIRAARPARSAKAQDGRRDYAPPLEPAALARPAV
jgi:hypothetical protein